MTRLTEEQYADLMRKRTSLVAATVPLAKKPKYRNVRCQSADGKSFASRLERDYYEQLLLRWKAGDVRWFILQPRFALEGGVIYVADFLVVTGVGDVEVVDTKGFLTPETKNKLRQMKARYGIDVQLVRKV